MRSTAVSSPSSQIPHARELLAEFKATGSQVAFEEIVRRYAGMVFGVCLRTTKNTHDAEDATQAVFLSLAVQCKTGDGVKYVGPWLQQVAKRVSLDIKRSRKRRETREQRHHAMNGNANGNGNGNGETAKNGAVDVDDLKGVLGEELSQLPSKYRLPLILHYFGGLTRDEMARELNCKPATLGVRIHRGREMLGRRLHERGAAPAGLVLSAALVAGAIRFRVSEGLLARTVEAACKLSTGQDLGSMIASNVLAISKSAAAGAALVAKLKTIAAVLVIASATAMATGAVAKFAPVNLQLPEFLKFNWVPKLKAPLPVPRFSAAQETSPLAPAIEEQPAKVELAGASPVIRSPEIPSRTASLEPREPAAPPAAAAASSPPRSKTAPRVEAAPQPTAAPTAVARATESAPAQASSTSTPPAAAASTGSPAASNVVAEGDVEVATVDSVPALLGEDKQIALRGASYLSVGGGGGSGSLGIFGGNVNFDIQDIGAGPGSTGVVDHFGGTNTFAQLRIGAQYGSRGTYNARDGAALRVKRGFPEGAAGILVGGEGEGILNLGDEHSTGNVFAVGESVPGSAEPSLVVRSHPLGSGRIEGWGTINLGGTFENNGETIANGFGHGRSLDFDGFSQVVNSIENPSDGGTHGWFARDGARLALPRIRIAAGTNTYTWGESPTDDVIDLVNSARITLHDTPANGFLEVALLALDRGGVPPLPRGHTFIGIWQIEAFTLVRDEARGVWTSVPMEPGGIDLSVRYDDTLAAELGLSENALKLWKYQDGRWTRILDGFERYPDLNILTGYSEGDIAYFAVSTPEPAAAGLLLLAGGYTLARRNRRR